MRQDIRKVVMMLYGIDADISTKYPLLLQRVKKLIIAFPTSYLVEMGFSKVNSLLTSNLFLASLETKQLFPLKTKKQLILRHSSLFSLYNGLKCS